MRLASFHSRPAHQGATVKVKEKMMQKMRVRSLGPGSSALPSFFLKRSTVSLMHKTIRKEPELRLLAAMQSKNSAAAGQ
jgi:hypothetical protein